MCVVFDFSERLLIGYGLDLGDGIIDAFAIMGWVRSPMFVDGCWLVDCGGIGRFWFDVLIIRGFVCVGVG